MASSELETTEDARGEELWDFLLRTVQIILAALFD